MAGCQQLVLGDPPWRAWEVMPACPGQPGCHPLASRVLFSITCSLIKLSTVRLLVTGKQLPGRRCQQRTGTKRLNRQGQLLMMADTET